MKAASSPYIPPKKIIQRYAQVLVRYALNSGEGVKPGEVVQCVVPDVAKPIALALQNEVLDAGGHPIVKLIPTEFDKDFFAHANEQQLTFFPKEFLKAKANLLDHTIGIIADTDPFELANTDPKKILTARNAKKQYRDWLVEKENSNDYTWTIALWGVPAKAKIVGLSEKAYWNQIVKACFLDKDNPVAEWKKVSALQASILEALNKMPIESLHITGPDVDLLIQLGKNRVWNGGSGRNIPSFELFTSPDWRGTEGWIQFNQPVYRYGSIIDDVRLEFKNGIVTKAKAKKGDRLLQEMLKTEGADKVGEYSLTDKRLSRITHVMAETLFDENIGGPHGNTHLALGMSYQDCYRGDPSKVTKKEWQEMGFNDSAEHTDIVSTTDRTVEATMTDGSKKVIYADGQFTHH